MVVVAVVFSEFREVTGSRKLCNEKKMSIVLKKKILTRMQDSSKRNPGIIIIGTALIFSKFPQTVENEEYNNRECSK